MLGSHGEGDLHDQSHYTDKSLENRHASTESRPRIYRRRIDNSWPWRHALDLGELGWRTENAARCARLQPGLCRKRFLYNLQTRQIITRGGAFIAQALKISAASSTRHLRSPFCSGDYRRGAARFGEISRGT